MSIPVKRLFTGEKPTLEFQVVNDDTGAPVDISGAAVDIFIRKQGAGSNLFADPNDNGTVIDGPNGKVQYVFPSALTVADLYQGQLKITVGAEIRLTEFFNLEVVAGLG